MIHGTHTQLIEPAAIKRNVGLVVGELGLVHHSRTQRRGQRNSGDQRVRLEPARANPPRKKILMTSVGILALVIRAVDRQQMLVADVLIHFCGQVAGIKLGGRRKEQLAAKLIDRRPIRIGIEAQNLLDCRRDSNTWDRAVGAAGADGQAARSCRRRAIIGIVVGVVKGPAVQHALKGCVRNR